MQRDEACQFHQYNSLESSTHVVRQFICHRSGIQPPKNDLNTEHSRFPKRSKKLNDFCPAQLYVTEKRAEGIWDVKMQKTHIGHCITSEEELAFVSIDDREKASICNKISLGVEQNTIFKQYEGKELSSGLKRRDIINYNGIANVGRVLSQSDPENVLKFITENQNRIHFYKPENHKLVAILEKFPKLAEDDFVLIYMDTFQEDLLRHFGGHVIAYDGTQPIPRGLCCILF